MARKTLKKIHKNIIENICCIVNNCADCYDYDGYNCRPYDCVDLFEMTKSGFYIEAYDGNKTNEELFEIANCCGYEATFVIKDNVEMIKFCKK